MGKGLRRLTALTGKAARASVDKGLALGQRIDALRSSDAGTLATGVAEVVEELEAAALPAATRARLRAALADVQKRLKEQQKQQAKAAAGSAVDEARRIAEQAGGKIIVAEISGADGDALRAAMDVIRKKRPDAALLLGGVSGGGAKVSFVAAVPETLIKQGLKAGDWVREVAKVAGGGGGGRPDMAQAGGKDPTKLQEALATGRQFAEAKVGVSRS